MTTHNIPTQKDLTNRIDILKATWRTSTVVPFYLLHPRMFFYYNYQIDLNSKSKLSGQKRTNLMEGYENILSQASCILRKKYLRPNNVRVYLNRLHMHFQKYGHYLPKFSEIMSSARSNQIGIVLRVKELVKSKYDNNIRILREDTYERTFLTWIESGKIVLVSESTVAGNEKMPSIDDFESYDNITIDQARELLPYVGFGSLLWTSPQDTDEQLFLSNDGLGWLIEWNSCLPTSQQGIPTIPSLKEYECRKWCVRSVSNNKTVTYEANVLISKDLGMMLTNKSGCKLRLEPEGWVTPWGRVPLTQDECRAATVALSISSRPTTLYKLTYTQDTVLHIVSGPSGYKSEAYVELCRHEMAKCKKDGICKMALIASKAEGKSTFIDLLQQTSMADEMFIEDSDDWGAYLSYLMIKTGKSTMQEIESELSDTTAIEHVKTFYTEYKLGRRYRSHFDLMARQLVRYAFDAKHRQNTSCYNTMHDIINHVKPMMKDYITKVNGMKHLNQKTFEDGIYLMNEGRSMMYICFLHMAEDNVRRRPADIITRFDTGTDSIINQAMRAESSQATTEEYIADVLLKIIYTDAAEFTIPKLTSGEILRMFGVVPVIGSDLKLKLYRDLA